MFDDTLLIVGSEFGRTPMIQNSGLEKVRQRARSQRSRLLHAAGRRRREGRHHLWRDG